jgi:hypothetical protein
MDSKVKNTINRSSNSTQACFIKGLLNYFIFYKLYASCDFILHRLGGWWEGLSQLSIAYLYQHQRYVCLAKEKYWIIISNIKQGLVFQRSCGLVTFNRCFVALV